MSLVYDIRDAGAPRRPAPLLAVGKEQAVYRQGDPADRLFRVVCGAVRTSRVLADGRRQIGGFYFPGDIVGLKAADQHRYSAEALSDVVLRVLDQSEASRQAVWAALALELERSQAHLLRLGRLSACERVASFLAEMAERCGGDEVALPMSRQDMADYLGLTIETVSRMLTRLQSRRIVRFAGCRSFTVTSPHGLRRLAA